LQEFNLHSGQVFILFELWKKNGLSQIELTSILRVSPPTVNKMVKSLKNNGFIACTGCPTDGRLTRVFLTPQGAAIRPQIEEMWKRLEIELVENLTPTEQIILSQLFSKINETLLRDKI